MAPLVLRLRMPPYSTYVNTFAFVALALIIAAYVQFSMGVSYSLINFGGLNQNESNRRPILSALSESWFSYLLIGTLSLTVLSSGAVYRSTSFYVQKVPSLRYP